MFSADITVVFQTGTIGAKKIYAHSIEQAGDDASHYVRNLVLKGREDLEVTGNADSMVASHKISVQKEADDAAY